jgi:hypothetical protein
VPRFIYGGYDNTGYSNINTLAEFTFLTDIWVLSLPGFRWFRADVQGPARFAHACALVGNRQMLNLGGVPTFLGSWTADDPPTDPWAQGLGILDLSSLNWSDQYDPAAPAYASPEMVQTFYSNGYVDLERHCE